MRVLVTGAGGQVGADVARLLDGRVQVAAHTRSSLDLEKPDDIRLRVREAHPDVIVNAAAYTAVDRAESEEERPRAVRRTRFSPTRSSKTSSACVSATGARGSTRRSGRYRAEDSATRVKQTSPGSLRASCTQ